MKILSLVIFMSQIPQPVIGYPVIHGPMTLQRTQSIEVNCSLHTSHEWKGAAQSPHKVIEKPSLNKSLKDTHWLQ